MAGALDGIKVLDLTRVLAGPWATQLLADLGAQVIKIEKPGAGDDTRHWGPPFVDRGNGERDAAYYLSANRGKESVAVDIALPEGRDLIAALAERCDVLVENFKVGGLARYGLDYASLSARNLGLVYCSITGFGQTGPYAERPGYDAVVQAMGGLMSLTGEPDGEPMKIGVALTDILTGLYAANAIQAALRHRDRTGQGQHIDMALLDVQVAVLANQALNYLVSGQNPKRYGNAHPNIVPYQTFRTKDGWLMLTVGNDAQFGRLCGVMHRPDLAASPDYATNDMRVQNRGTLAPLIQSILMGRTTREWMSLLEPVQVPADAINTLSQVFDDPQVIHRGMRAHLPAGDGIDTPTVPCPIKMSATPPQLGRAPARLGQDTGSVLIRELGLSEAELDRLVGAGAI
jgi:crotonobetainyl-CoA:carnitine CoA-transferase CaiB-like acyl-CoA transferase